MELKKFIIKCINMNRGDDLARARNAFDSFSFSQMQEQHGSSGKTRQQILDSYIEHEKKCDDAIKEINKKL